MAVIKTPQSTSLVMEIANGVDDKGSTLYRKKTFSNVSVAASIDNVYAVAQAIALILENGTRDYLLKNSAKLVNQA